MKALVITGETINGVPSIQKATKNGVSEYREFRYNGVFANFWGQVDKDEDYEFVFVPKDQKAYDEDPDNYSGGGVLRRLGGQREVHEITVKDKDVKTKAVTALPTPSLLKLLMKK